jgi:hypothetical protein
MGDATIIEAFADCAAKAAPGDTLAFVTHNPNDFSEQKGNTKKPHPDIASIFTKRKVRFFTTLADALKRIRPDAVAELAVDLEQEPRRTDEILEAIDLLWHQVWYNRHMILRQRVADGAERVDPKVWKLALASARRVKEKYGQKNLGPWHDFDWGMLNGKLSALNWVLGDGWDMLDT